MKQTNCTVNGCYNYGRYCRLHLTPVAPVKVEIPKESEASKEANKEYKKKCAAFKKEHPVCQAKLAGICKTKTADVHHMKGRSSKDDLLDEKFWLAVCRPCHDTLEKNPAFAKQAGLSVSRLSSPSKNQKIGV